MNESLWKFLVLAAIIIGESVMIIEQMFIAKAAKQGSLSMSFIFLLVFWSVIGVLLVLGGYYAGYLVFKNIWIVGVISVGSVLVAEVALAITIFGETPTVGAWIGLACGLIGITASLLF